MFKRFFSNFALIFLFAFAQVGAVTHEISHIKDYVKHSQQDSNRQEPSKQDPSNKDQNTHNGQCVQCISYAGVVSGLQTQAIIFHLVPTKYVATTFNPQSYPSFTRTAYVARAPPQTS